MVKGTGYTSYFIDIDGKSKLANEENNWMFKGIPFHALMEWNFPYCKKTLIISFNGIELYGANEKQIYVLCSVIYKYGYLIYKNLDDIIYDIQVVKEKSADVNVEELILKVKGVESDLQNGVYDEQLKKMEDQYLRETMILQGNEGEAGIHPLRLTPVEQASKLIISFHLYAYATLSDCNGFEANGAKYKKEKIKNAKQCALICVDMLIKESDPLNYDSELSQLQYWENVKREIEKY